MVLWNQRRGGRGGTSFLKKLLIERTRQVELFCFPLASQPDLLQLKNSRLYPFLSPHRTEGKEPNLPNQPSIGNFAADAYNGITKKATEDLMVFLSGIQHGALCVMYFDEAHHLDTALWVLLRLLMSQAESTRMWHVFMGTKSNYSFYAPNVKNS